MRAMEAGMPMMELVEGRICPPRSMSEVDVGLGEELEGLDLMLMCVARSSCGPRVGHDVDADLVVGHGDDSDHATPRRQQRG